MKALSWINFILGLWLIVAGFAFVSGAGTIMAQEVVLGIIIAVLAYWAAVGTPNSGVSWCVAVAGLIVLLAPAAVTYGTFRAARGNDIIVGLIVLVLGFVNAVYRQSAVRTHA